MRLRRLLFWAICIPDPASRLHRDEWRHLRPIVPRQQIQSKPRPVLFLQVSIQHGVEDPLLDEGIDLCLLPVSDGG
jgi:hypothetical protein